MSDNPTLENLGDELEDVSIDYSGTDFTFSHFDTKAVFGENPANHIPGESNAPSDTPTLKPEDFRESLFAAPPANYKFPSDYQKTGNQQFESAPPLSGNEPPSIGSKTETVKAYFNCHQCGNKNWVGDSYCGFCGVFTKNYLVNDSKIADKTVPLPRMSESGERVDRDAESKNFSGDSKDFSSETNFLFQDGTILDNRYRILRHLGSGGFGDIYMIENTDSYFPEVRVLKLVHRKIAGMFSFNTPEELRDSFQTKYKKWRVLSQEEPDFIVRLDNVKVIEQRVGILMELMDGGTLLELVESWGGKPQTNEHLKQLVKLFIEASRALHVIHKYKLIHCDVKPHNFLLDAEQQKCKLCDFELLNKREKKEREEFSKTYNSDKSTILGTPYYMSPESFAGEHSVKSDIFALGVTFYYLLSGKYPYDNLVLLLKNFTSRTVEPPKSLSELNPLVPASLDRLVGWCLELDEAERPDSIADLIYRLLQLGISDEESNFAPVNLAQLLINHLSPIDLKMLMRQLENQKFRSMSEVEYQQRDLIEEYCYTTSPFEILEENCGGSSLYAIADSLKIDTEPHSRRDLVKEIVKALGFLPGKRQPQGFETIRRDLEAARIKFEGSETVAECRGNLDAAFAEMERAVGLLIGFYGQTIYGKGLKNFLAKKTRGKPIEKLSFGAKIDALRDLCLHKPKAPLPERAKRIFNFPLIKPEIFEEFGKIVAWRNDVAHNRAKFASVHAAQSHGQQIFQSIIGTIKTLLSSPYTPRVVQITDMKTDVYGRQFYEGYDEKEKKEKIFTTFGLRVGQLYWFVPLTNPVRINPLIFDFEEPVEKPSRETEI